MPANNPFYYNQPTKPEDFLGRWPLVEDISSDLLNPVRADSWALIGGRRFGKSSVLNALKFSLVKNSSIRDSKKRSILPVIVDLKASEKKTERNIYWRILWELYRALRHSSIPTLDLSSALLSTVANGDREECSFMKFEESLDDLTGRLEGSWGAARVAILLDEVEAAVNFSWTETLFDQLRSLVYGSQLADKVKIVLTGSIRVIQVRQSGSPLLNTINVKHLEAFSVDDIKELIAPAAGISEEASIAVHDQSGGHPFIAQYLLHHLWKKGIAQATAEQVEQTARQMRRERAADLQGWWEAVGEDGRNAYALLTHNWQDENALIVRSSRLANRPDHGLTALCYHGLAIRDESGRRYRTAGTLFRDWFLQHSLYSQSENGPMIQKDRQTVTWLHLSDIHFTESSTYDENIVLRALVRDVNEQIHDEGLKPDFIVVTGDIAFSGNPAEYALARHFFETLLNVTGLARERLFIVPGNHDVNRKLITRGAKAIGAALNDRDSTNTVLASREDRQLLLARFRGYAEFFNEYFAGHLTFNDDSYFYTYPFKVNGIDIALLGLNSAWLSESNQDKEKKLVIGEAQTRKVLDAALVANAKLKIALMHHPFDWLREFDQKDSAALLLDNSDFILHGHLHQTALTQLGSPDSNAMIIAGGACYETREYPNSYNFVRLNLESGVGVVHLRRYSDQRGGFWARDTLLYKNVRDGIYEFSLAQR